MIGPALLIAALALYAAFQVAGRFGFGPMAPAPSPVDARQLRGSQSWPSSITSRASSRYVRAASELHVERCTIRAQGPEAVLA